MLRPNGASTPRPGWSGPTTRRCGGIPAGAPPAEVQQDSACGQRHLSGSGTGQAGGSAFRAGRGARALCDDRGDLIPSVDDSWCRDSGPTFICRPELGSAAGGERFNAWGGGKSGPASWTRGWLAASSTSLELVYRQLSGQRGGRHPCGRRGTLITH